MELNALQRLKSLLISSIGMFVAQLGIVLILYVMCNIITLFTYFLGEYFISGFVTFSLFTLVWWLIWRVIYDMSGTAQFPVKLTFSTLPLIGLAVFYIWQHPTPNYTLMIPRLPTDIHFYFATAITGTLLFPWYSIALHRYWSHNGSRRKRRLLLTASPIAMVGVACFTLCYCLLPANW
ncbi:hypothetical protein [Alicyclobacillus acidoterrestris]|uniref:Uncharacterized protein n=1 Tax=Alicyclobacillus acidoterrestris (strain ATCC 49025 / DSM 3922 / CIP 106132 / NCIMB 13137 / GD3B) TaxID=1356854 RepID=T0DQ11_ALIAG|nr:hypothetical protein [Alicyclobacillus acidoterrestris]EPZ51541.1 hypothetical protein N007_03000 [Alicyclobacillus acidoterrestris ATCC 49025]UNO50608.1 hypothetical protein K1I37_09260 [Alicyclobacillus acidoterrestris]